MRIVFAQPFSHARKSPETEFPANSRFFVVKLSGETNATGGGALPSPHFYSYRS